MSKSGIVRKGRTNANLTVGTLRVNGTKSLIVGTSGKTRLKKFYDIIFKPLGNVLTCTYDSREKRILHSTVSIFGSGACFQPTYMNIYASSPLAARNVTSSDVIPHHSVNTSYIDARLVKFKITVRPSNFIGKRAGTWSLVFTPFRNEYDRQMFATGIRVPEVSECTHILGAITGPADKALSLTFSPEPSDGICFRYNKLVEPFGVVHIAYSNYNRTSYVEFTSEEFSPEIIISGEIHLRTGFINDTSTVIKDEIIDSLKSIGIRLLELDYVDQLRNKGCYISNNGPVSIVRGLVLSSSTP